MSSSITKNVFTLKAAYELINAGCIQYSAGRREPGSLWAWGRNSCTSGSFPGGSLGDNTTIAKSSPVQIPGTTWVEVSVSAEGRRSLGRKSDGTLWSWGPDRFSAPLGLLGLNDTIPRSSPTQIPGTQWCAISVGSCQSHAIKTNGTLWSWGWGGYGSLGLNDTIHRSSPTQVPGTNWINVCGASSHTLAKKSDGTLWSWGVNNGGGLGDNTVFPRSSPVQVPGINWGEISAGVQINRSIASKTDGTLWSWGVNNTGELGLGDTIGRSSPVQIPGTNWCNVLSSGRRTTLAQKTDGTLWSWGYQYRGTLGDGTTISRSSPVQVPGNQWKTVAVGAEHVLAIKTDSTLWAWGRGSSYGALGDNTTIDKSSPIQIPGQWIDVGTGAYHSFARKLA